MQTAIVLALWSTLASALSTAIVPTGQTPEPPAYPAVVIAELPSAKVTSVIDADTVELAIPAAGLTLEVDLAGIKGPGLKTPFGPEAAMFTRLLLQGEDVRIAWTDDGQPSDRGRRSGLIYREPDALCVNLELIRAGLAEPRAGAGQAFDEVAQIYADRARALGRGWLGDGERISLLQPIAEPDQAESDPEAAVSGDEEAAPPGRDAQAAGLKYFVTRSGSKYHRETCRFVSDTAREITLDDAQARYQPCSVCKPDTQ